MAVRSVTLNEKVLAKDNANLARQIVLISQYVGDLLYAPLATDRISKRRKDRRLPAVSMILSNHHLQAINASRRAQHLRKLLSGFPFFGHRNFPEVCRPF
jgi:hypothetical protein